MKEAIAGFPIGVTRRTTPFVYSPLGALVGGIDKTVGRRK